MTDILDGIVRDEDAMADYIHPNDGGYAVVIRRVARAPGPYIQPE